MTSSPNPELETIVHKLLEAGSLSGTWERLIPLPRLYKERGAEAAIRGEIDIDGQPIMVVVGFKSSFPLSVPLVYIQPANALGFIPHLEADGYACYVRGDGQFVNYHQPAAVVRDALQRTRETLSRGYRGENTIDFTDGFAEYWSRLPNTGRTQSLVKPSESFKKIILATGSLNKKKQTSYLADDEQTIRSFSVQLRDEVFNIKKAFYVPLEKGTPLIPPSLGAMWSLQDIHQIIKLYTSEKTRHNLQRAARKWKSVETVILGLPRPGGGWALFGITFSGVQYGYPLCEGSLVNKLQPIILDRLDRDYLMTRGGSSSSLHTKHVAIIGCGSVGASVAVELARSGVGRLTLVDNDVLSAENVFRHPVGQYAVGMSKVDAVKSDLKLRIPYIQVTALAERIETLIRTKKFSWSDYNLIVIATGEPTINQYLNESLRRRKSSPPALYTWIDPYGIGGHTLLEQYHDQPGCLQCLYEFTEDGYLANRASFALPGQSFLKDLSGCGSLFTPFGSLDVLRTAEQTVRMALNSLAGKGSNQICSWKGDSTIFRELGYQLTSRYESTEQELINQRTSFHRTDCPICHLS